MRPGLRSMFVLDYCEEHLQQAWRGREWEDEFVICYLLFGNNTQHSPKAMPTVTRINHFRS